MEEKVRGIVLNGISIGESDKLLNIFTLEKGVVSTKIKGVKKAGAKLKFASEPFCFAEFIFSTTGDRRTLIGATLIDSFYSLREDIKKYYAGAVILEYLRKFLKEGIVSEKAFVLAIDSLKEIAYSDKHIVSQLVRFLLSALSLSGFAINLLGCFNCAKDISGKIYFDYNSGGFFCEECFNGTGREISIHTFNNLRRIEEGLDLEDGESVKCLKLLDYYLGTKTEVKFNSLSELLKITN